jgi:hypothetical protein
VSSGRTENDDRAHPGNRLVLAELGLVEPESDLLGSRVETVRSVDQVSSTHQRSVGGEESRSGKGVETHPTETAY